MSNSNEPAARDLETVCEKLWRSARDKVIRDWMYLWSRGPCTHISETESLPRVFETTTNKNTNYSGPVFSECERLSHPLFQFCYYHPKLPNKMVNVILRIIPIWFETEAFFQTTEKTINGVHKDPTLRDVMFLYPSGYSSSLHDIIDRLQTRNFNPNHDVYFRDESPHQKTGRIHHGTREMVKSVVGDPKISKHALSALEEVYGKEILKAWFTEFCAELFFNESQQHEYPYHAIGMVAAWCDAKQINLIITNDVGERNGFRHKAIVYPMKEATLEIHSTVSETSNSRFALNAIISGLCKGSIPLAIRYMFEENGIVDERDPAILPTLDQFVLERNAFCNMQQFQAAARVTDPNQIVTFASSLSGCQTEVQVTLYIHIDSESEMEQWNNSVATMGSIESLYFLGFHMHEESLFPAAGIRQFLATTTTVTCLRIWKYPFRTLAPLADGVARNKSLKELYLHQGEGIELDCGPLLSVLYSSNCTLEYYLDDYLSFGNKVRKLCRLNAAGRFRLLEPEATKETLVEVLMRLQVDGLCNNPYRSHFTEGVYELLRVRPSLWST